MSQPDETAIDCSIRVATNGPGTVCLICDCGWFTALGREPWLWTVNDMADGHYAEMGDDRG